MISEQPASLPQPNLPTLVTQQTVALIGNLPNGLSENGRRKYRVFRQRTFNMLYSTISGRAIDAEAGLHELGLIKMASEGNENALDSFHVAKVDAALFQDGGVFQPVNEYLEQKFKSENAAPFCIAYALQHIGLEKAATIFSLIGLKTYEISGEVNPTTVQAIVSEFIALMEQFHTMSPKFIDLSAAGSVIKSAYRLDVIIVDRMKPEAKTAEILTKVERPTPESSSLIANQPLQVSKISNLLFSTVSSLRQNHERAAREPYLDLDIQKLFTAFERLIKLIDKSEESIDSETLIFCLSQLEENEIFLILCALGLIDFPAIKQDEDRFFNALDGATSSLELLLGQILKDTRDLPVNDVHRNRIIQILTGNQNERYYENLYGYTLRLAAVKGKMPSGSYFDLQQMIITGQFSRAIVDKLTPTQNKIFTMVSEVYFSRAENIFPTVNYLALRLDMTSSQVISEIRKITSILNIGSLETITRKITDLDYFESPFRFKPSKVLRPIYRRLKEYAEAQTNPMLDTLGDDLQISLRELQRLLDYLNNEITAFIDGELIGVTEEQGGRIAEYRNNQIIYTINFYRNNFEALKDIKLHEKYRPYFDYIDGYLFGDNDLLTLPDYSGTYGIPLANVHKHFVALQKIFELHSQEIPVYFEPDGKLAITQSRNRYKLRVIFDTHRQLTGLPEQERYVQLTDALNLQQEQVDLLQRYLKLDGNNTFGPIDTLELNAFSRLISEKVSKIKDLERTLRRRINGTK